MFAWPHTWDLSSPTRDWTQASLLWKQSLTTVPREVPLLCSFENNSEKFEWQKGRDISQWSLRVEPGFMPPQSFSTPIQYPGWSSWLSYQVSMNFLSCRPGCALATSKGHLRTWSERSSQELAMKWTKYSYLHRRACQKRSHLNVWSWGRGGWGTWYLDMGGISPRGEVEGSFSAAKYKKIFWVLVSILTPNMNFA